VRSALAALLALVIAASLAAGRAEAGAGLAARITAANAWMRAGGGAACDRCLSRPPGSAIVWTYYAGQGLFPNWVHAATELFARQRRDPAGFRAGVAEIVRDSTPERAPDGTRFRVNQSAYVSPDGQPPPWHDAMGTALTLALLVPALPPRPAPAVLAATRRTAEQYLGGFFVDWTRGGLRWRDGGPGAWYLEYAYATGARMRVLNGFMQTLVSLGRFAWQADGVARLHPAWAGLRDRALLALREGVRALVRLLPLYDLGSWSRYSLTKSPASAAYHVFHRHLLSRLAQLPMLPLRWRAILEGYRVRWGGSPETIPGDLVATPLNGAGPG
jgi:hypothetical protein